MSGIAILGETHRCTCEYKLLSESQGTVNCPVTMVTALILLTMMSSLKVLKAASAKKKALHSSMKATIQLNSSDKNQLIKHWKKYIYTGISCISAVEV